MWLSARLAANHDRVQRPVRWRIQSIDGNGDRKTVARIEAPTARLMLPPGDYHVEASYGLTRESRTVRVHPDSIAGLTVLLNTGGLRMLSLAGRATVPDGVTARHTIRRDGDEAPLATSTVPGEIIRLPAGRYHVASALHPGNARLEMDMDVQPGRLHAVEFDHQAGLVTVSAEVGHSQAAPVIRILDHRGKAVAQASGTKAAFALLPGHYRAVAEAHGEVLYVVKFEVTSGESANIALSGE